MNYTKSFVYVEILMETLIILLVATELSLEYTNEEGIDTRVDPWARGVCVRALLGIWQGNDIWTEMTKHPRVSSIFSLTYRTINNNPYWSFTISGFGTLAFTCATAFLYIAFAVFLCSNRNWNPARFDVPNKAAKALQDSANRFIWQVLGLQGLVPILLIMSHLGWPESSIFSVVTLVAVWFCVFTACTTMCTHTPGKGLDGALVQDWHAYTTNPEQSKKCILSILLCPLRMLWLCVRMVVSFIMAVILALIPLIPVLIWSGLIQLIVFLFGKQAAFPAHIVLSILLITYANGRLLGWWMTKSHIRWITIKILSALGKASYMDHLFLFKRIGTELECSVQSHRKEWTSLFLDCMSICVLSFPLWAAYVIGTNIEANNYESAFLVRSFFGDHMLPKGLAPILAKVSFWTNVTCSTDAPVKCKEWQSVPVDGVIGTVGMIVSTTLAHATLVTLIVMLFAACVFYITSGIKKLCSMNNEQDQKKANKRAKWDRMTWTARLHDCHSAMALVPHYIVKTIFPVYALELLAPENMFIPGITVWLAWAAICFYKNLSAKLFDLAKCETTKAVIVSECERTEVICVVGDISQLNVESDLRTKVANELEKDTGAQLTDVALV